MGSHGEAMRPQTPGPQIEVEHKQIGSSAGPGVLPGLL